MLSLHAMVPAQAKEPSQNAPAQRRWLSRASDLLGRMFFGYDFFISYGHLDGQAYAISLFDALVALGYRCFLDREDMPPGEVLSLATKRGLERSQTLLLVGTPRTLASEPVLTEVSLFRRMGKTIIPIDLNRTLELASPQNPIQRQLTDVIRLPEQEQYGSAPSEEVIKKIAGSYRHTRQNIRRQRWLIAAVAVFSTLAVSASIAAYVAERARQESDRQRRIALSRELGARSELMRSRDANLLRQSALLAVEARRIQASVDIDESLRKDLSLLAPPGLVVSHPDEINSLSLSPDGQLAVTSCEDGRIRLWRTNDGKIIHTITVGDAVSDAEFSPDGKLLVSAVSDGTVRVWNRETELQVGPTLQAGESDFAQFSPGGAWIAAGGTDRAVRIWDAKTFSKVLDIPFPFTITGVRFTRDDRIVAAADQMGNVQIWSLLARRRVAKFQYGTSIEDLGVSPDGKALAIASSGNGAALWALPSGTLAGKLTESADADAVVFSHDGNLVAVGLDDGSTRIWSRREGREVKRLMSQSSVFRLSFSPDDSYLLVNLGPSASIWDVSHGVEVRRLTHDLGIVGEAFLPDRKSVVTASADGFARAWKYRGSGRLMQISHPAAIQDVVADATSGRIITADNEGTINLWSITTGDLLFTLRQPGLMSYNVSLTPDAHYLAAGAATRQVWLWDIERRKVFQKLQEQSTIQAVQFSPDGKTIAVSAWDHTVHLYSVSTGLLQTELPKHPDRVRALAYSPDGRLLATACMDGIVRVWEVETKNKRREFQHGGQLWSVAFDVSGALLASASSDHTAKIWEVSAPGPSPWHEVRHDSGVERVVFSPDGRHLASTGWDNTVRIWDVSTGREIARATQSIPLLHLAFSPNGAYLVAAGSDGLARVIEWSPNTLEGSVCESVTRNLLAAEWKQYLPGIQFRKTCSKLP
jgi:WD40 repeat protein